MTWEMLSEMLVGIFTWGSAIGLALLFWRLWPARRDPVGIGLLILVGGLFLAFMWLIVVETLAIFTTWDLLGSRQIRSVVARGTICLSVWATLWWVHHAE
jgi:hypothetical protein